jgi:hypothetical protein
MNRVQSTLMRNLLLTALLLCSTVAPAHAADIHEIDFWRAIAKNKFAVPDGESADSLAQELSRALASPNPELRDDLAYSILHRWIVTPGTLTQPTLEALTDEWRANLETAATVIHRSFSALCLSSMAKREARAPFMGETRFHQLVADALHYLRDENDLRGYDAKLGWIHATGHTADLLEALALSKHLTNEEGAAILSAVAHRLSTAPRVYTQGEQDRLAAAVKAVILRPAFDPASLETWLSTLEKEDRAVWQNPLTPESLAVYQNHTYMLQGLAVRLSLEAESTTAAKFKTKVLAILRTR